METKRPVAVFDIDGTLFRSSLLIELIDELVARDMLPQSVKDSYRALEIEWKRSGTGYETYIKKAIASFGKHAKGLPYGEVADIAGEIIESKKDNVYRYTRDLLEELRGKNYFLLAVSRSPKFIVDGFAYEHGFHKSYGTFYATGASNRFTGEIEDEHLIMNKSAILMRAVEREVLTLSGSIGIGDTEADTSMLDLVETPIAFNPSRALYRHAKGKGWKVIVEQKDVIYEL
jgi:HAD superfamily phosphoserine phosphatase-like hydrolase